MAYDCSYDTDERTLPAGMRRFMRRRLQELSGIIAFAVLIAVGIALATWSASDPSPNNAIEAVPQNWLGSWGAAIADQLIQLFGLAVLPLILLPMVWAGRLVCHQPMTSLMRRIFFWFCATISACAALHMVPNPKNWALISGLGGNIGDVLGVPIHYVLSIGLKGILASLVGFVLLSTTSAWFSLRALYQHQDEQVGWDRVLFDKIGQILEACYRAFVSWRQMRRQKRHSARRQPALVQRSLIRPAAAPSSRDTRATIFERLAPNQQTDEEGYGQRIAASRLIKKPVAKAEPMVEKVRASRESWGQEREAGERLERQIARRIEPFLSQVQDSAETAVQPSNRILSRLKKNVLPRSEIQDEQEENDISYHHDEDCEDLADVEEDVLGDEEATEAEILPKVRVPARPKLTRPVAALQQARSVAPVRHMVKAVAAKPKQFSPPPLNLLSPPKSSGKSAMLSDETLEEQAGILERVLQEFGVRGQIVHVRPGPVVTLYELIPAAGIKSSRVIALADDVARSMSAVSARIAVIPGRNAIGIELPNDQRETVFLRELLASDPFQKSGQNLSLALGKNIGGEPIFVDLAGMPHLLIAGTTGSGKSVGINTMILSLLYRMSPDRCKLIMIDPKMLELSVYEGIPHLLTPVVTDPRKAVVALKWAVREMEDRYRKMSKVGVRNIDGYNERLKQARTRGETISRTVQTGFDDETGEPVFEQENMDLKSMPYIVVIIDEMADLMMVAGKDIEGAVQRLAQMARAAGIHLIMATQRPSVDVITGTIKANFPTRISFQVTSKIDSRTILGEQGAEQLLGQGDMLYMAKGGRTTRVHGPFVSDGEVEKIVNHLKLQGTPEYIEAVTEDIEELSDVDMSGLPGGDGGSGDHLYDQAVAVVMRDKKVSTSYIQRRLQIGYNKAASLIERMEQDGLISAANGTGKREILMDSTR